VTDRKRIPAKCKKKIKNKRGNKEEIPTTSPAHVNWSIKH
jgi:hypothetical protein